MTNELTTYYIPSNPNILKGHIYTLYLNHNTNLDLTPILNKTTITVNSILKNTNSTNKEQAKITMSEEDYLKLVELNKEAHDLTIKRSDNIKNFIQFENQTTNLLTQINVKRQELIKKLVKKGP